MGRKGFNKYETSGDTTKLFITTYRKGIVETLIDTEDLPKLISYGQRWSLFTETEHHRYATSMREIEGKRKFVALHRIILDAPKGLLVDHINGDTLDNRKSNIRIVTPSQNQFNRRIQKNNTSGVPGLRWRESKNRWEACIMFNRQCVYQKHFKEFSDAVNGIEIARAKIMATLPRPASN